MEKNEPLRVVVTAPLGIGGITTMMINIQKHLDKEKVKFDYLVINDGPLPMDDVIRELGSRKLVASANDIKFRPFRRIVRIGRIRRVCKEEHVEIVHFNGSDAFILTNIIGAKLGGAKYIVIHSHNGGYGQAKKIIRVMSEICKPFLPLFCDEYLACSNLAAEFLFPKSVIKKGKYKVITNGIDISKYEYKPDVRDSVRKELGIEDNFVVIHAGRFSAQKNHKFLIDIFAEVYKKDRSAVLLLFGEGELTENIKKKVEDLGLTDAVRFMGTTNRMHEMWQAADVFLMPSLHEGLPVAGIEAQTSGLPCVFSDTITKEVDISSKSAFLSLNDSAEKWAGTVLSCKGQERINGRDAARAAHYDIQETADTMTEIYLNLGKKK